MVTEIKSTQVSLYFYKVRLVHICEHFFPQMKSQWLVLQSKMKMINYAKNHFSFFPPLRQICFDLINFPTKITCVWNNFVTKLILPVPRNMTWYVAYFPSTISTAIWSSLKKKNQKNKKILNLSNLIHHVNTFQNSRRNSGVMRGYWGIPPVRGSLPLAPLLTEKKLYFVILTSTMHFVQCPPPQNK